MNTDMVENYPVLIFCAGHFAFLIEPVLLSSAIWLKYFGHSFTGDMGGLFESIPFYLFNMVLGYRWPRFFIIIVIIELLLIVYLEAYR
jgi:hypothetical protein